MKLHAKSPAATTTSTTSIARSIVPLALMTAAAIACGESSDDGADSTEGAATGKPAAMESSFERREAIDMVAGGFTRTSLNPSSGSIQGAHGEKFVVEGTNVFTTKNFATGAKDKRCGTVKVSDSSVDFTGTCGLASSYGIDPTDKTKRRFERRESIDLTKGGFTRTQLNPKTGIIIGAHGDKFVVEGTTVFTTKNFVTGAKDKQCGTIKVSANNADFTGTCDLWSSYDKK